MKLDRYESYNRDDIIFGGELDLSNLIIIFVNFIYFSQFSELRRLFILKHSFWLKQFIFKSM